MARQRPATWIGAGEWILTSARRYGIAERAEVRSARVRRSGSPWYEYGIGVIAASASADYALENQFPQAMKYAYCDEVEIINNDAVDLILHFNGSGTAGFHIPAGTITHFADMPVRQWRVTNNGGIDTTSGAIRIAMRRMPETADTAARGKPFHVR